MAQADIAAQQQKINDEASKLPGLPVIKNHSSIAKPTLEPHIQTKLTPQERVKLEALAMMSEDRIDHTDAPTLPRANWVKAFWPADTKAAPCPC